MLWTIQKWCRMQQVVAAKSINHNVHVHVRVLDWHSNLLLRLIQQNLNAVEQARRHSSRALC